MIDIKTAVNAARTYIISVQEIMGNLVENLRLEEIELSEDKNFWLITLGFDVASQTKGLGIGLGLYSPTYQREYKLFKVNSQTGEVEAMKIREV